MADIYGVTPGLVPGLVAQLEEWLASEPRPQIVLDLARRFPPWKLYRNKSANGQRVTVIAYAEDGTLRVNVSGEYNLLIMGERQVFGIKPEDLEECDLPGPDELVGDLFGGELRDALYPRP